MKLKRFALALLVSPLAVLGISAQAQESPVVVELFTSQSCSSCPAADRALRELARHNRDILALSCHVTYWDHLDWKDTLSRQDCTERQRTYAAFHGNGRRVYTPQMVVNGVDSFVGSSESKAERAISAAQQVRPIAISRRGSETIQAKLPALPHGAYEIQVFGYKRNHQEDVPRGENRGKRLNYTNSVTYVGAPHTWDGQSLERLIALPGGKTAEVDGIVVLAQSLETGAILAAGNLEGKRDR